MTTIVHRGFLENYDEDHGCPGGLWPENTWNPVQVMKKRVTINVRDEIILERVKMYLNGTYRPRSACKATLEPDPLGIVKPIWITGHSMGAALAVLCAFDLAHFLKDSCGWSDDDVKKNVKCATFASPRVGGMDFKQKYDALGIPTYRIVHGQDICPRVPRKYALNQENGKRSSFTYLHVGEGYHVDSINGAGFHIFKDHLECFYVRKLHSILANVGSWWQQLVPIKGT